MESVITKLSEIEIAAERIMDQAVQQKKELDREMENKSSQFDSQVEDETKERLETLRCELQDQFEKELSYLRNGAEQAMDVMEKTYQQKHEQLSDEILNEIIRM